MVKKLGSFVRGDTPRFAFTISQDGVLYDLTGYNATITITANQNPSTIDDAVVKKQPMAIDLATSTAAYQLTATVSKTLAVGTTYYGDMELTKNPIDTNTFTPIKFSFTVTADYGI